MDVSEAGKLGYKALIKKNGKNYMSELSKRAAEKRSKLAQARKNEANLVLDTERSV
jgi:hypothetical protein